MNVNEGAKWSNNSVNNVFWTLDTPVLEAELWQLDVWHDNIRKNFWDSDDNVNINSIVIDANFDDGSLKRILDARGENGSRLVRLTGSRRSFSISLR